MKFIIVGAGLYGVVLAYKLRASGHSVTLIDGSGIALSAWRCASVGSISVNPGFHIIERDRNKALVAFLRQEVKSDFLEIENYRSIAIGTVARNYAYSSAEEDPVLKDPFGSLIMRPDIPEKLSKPCDLIPYFSQETKQMLRIIANTRGFHDLRSFCSHIFPWFYPGRYDLLNASDEGSRFNSQIRSGDRVHVGLIPRSGLFSDLSSQINDRLRELCIPLVSKKFADHSDIRSLVSNNTRVIVTLPAPVVLESKPRLSLYLLAFSIGVNTEAKWLEMPVLSPSVPYLTRIFKGLYDGIFYCECLLEELSNETISEVQGYFDLLFQDPCQFIGSTWIRYVYRPSSEQLDAADNEIEPYLLRQAEFLRRSRLDQSSLAYERYVKRLEVEIERNAKTRQRFERDLVDLGFVNSSVHYINHHLSHCYGSYSLSPFQEAYSFSFDGRGDLESSASYFFSRQDSVKLNFELTISSLGLLYGQITAYLGFKPHRHEGKITGLSARGNSTKTRAIFDELIKLENCNFYPNLELYNPFYKPIDSNLANQLSNHSPEDVAAGLQEFTQEIITKYITQTLEASNVRSPVNICLSGGVAANVLLNMHIRNLPLCKNLFVFPHMGDGGIPLGSALYTSSQLGFSSNDAPTSMYLGPDYSPKAILSSLRTNSSRVAYESSDSPDLEAAQCLANGLVVGWFQSRMEYGPRALCNRSILAPAVDASINKTLNARMHRTEFMPFAPVTADTFAPTAFPNIPKSSYSEYKFMTITAHASQEFASMHPAVIHVDGTCRPQIVTQQDNPIMHQLLHSYHTLTGNTALVNTSFNSHEEPIVCSPCDAIAALLSGIVDVLFIGNYRVTCKQ